MPPQIVKHTGPVSEATWSCASFQLQPVASRNLFCGRDRRMTGRIPRSAALGHYWMNACGKVVDTTEDLLLKAGENWGMRWLA